MTVYQKIVAMIGALALIIVIITGPRYFELGRWRIPLEFRENVDEFRKSYVKYDFGTIVRRSAIIVILTVTAILVLSGKRDKKKSRKIIRFLC